AVTGVAAGAALGVLGEHVALDGAEVAQQIAEAEGPRPRRPVEAVAGDAGGHSHGAATDAIEVGGERSGALNLHAAPSRLVGGRNGTLNCDDFRRSAGSPAAAAA